MKPPGNTAVAQEAEAETGPVLEVRVLGVMVTDHPASRYLATVAHLAGEVVIRW